MSDCVVTFRATVNGLVIILRQEDGFESIMGHIEEKVAQAGKFFKGASITVKYRGKTLSKDQEDRIFELLSKKTGAEIKSVERDDEEALKAQAQAVPQQPKIQMKRMFYTGIEEGLTKFYRGTVRSGQLVNFGGNVVVIGDVNPGGEIVAAGNVVVMGSLRGLVHAGADGNKDAVVVAFNLQPTQLRIADVITRSPDEKGQKGVAVPELASVKDDMVYIERFLPQR